MDFKLTTLTNGVRLLYGYKPSPITYCGFAINVGSKDEDINEYGIAHFIEHLFFKGTEKRNNIQIIKRLEEVGGEIDAYTTKEETYIYAVVPRKYTERAIELLSDIVFSSTFLQKHINTEKDVVFEEIDMYNDSPSELIFDEFEDLVFHDSPLGHNILGTKESVEKITSKKCHNFIDKHYTTENLLFFIQSDLSDTKILKWVEKHIIPQNIKKGTKAKHLYNYSPKNLVVPKDVFQTHCIIGAPINDISERKRPTLSLLNNIIGGNNLTSRLNISIREKHGWVYSIESNMNLFSDIGIWNIYFGCSENKYTRCISLINEELNKICNKPISKSQLEKYKQQLCGQMLISAQNTENYILASAKYSLTRNKIFSLDKAIDSTKGISSQDIQNCAREIFCKENFTSVKYQNK